LSTVEPEREMPKLALDERDASGFLDGAGAHDG
jgi:hypothetical protein